MAEHKILTEEGSRYLEETVVRRAMTEPDLSFRQIFEETFEEALVLYGDAGKKPPVLGILDA